MKKNKTIFPLLMVLSLGCGCALAGPGKEVIDEVAWVVGDEAIFRSDVEELYQQMRSDGVVISGDPYCVLPEQIAVEKLYLHQAKIDTIEVPESRIRANVESQINFYVSKFGTKEKVEEFFRKPIPVLREQLVEVMRNNAIVQQVQRELTKDVKSTPNEVRKFFDKLPADSIPYVPMQVEAQIITIKPNIPRQEIEDVKARLRDFADRVNKGEADFSTLAILNSEDGSAMQGGELGFRNKASMVPEFANVAFNLSDPKKASRIVETEYGYHIIQLIEKRGDQVNVRHILLRPKVNPKDLKDATNRLDSIRKEIVAGAFTFDWAAGYFSDDKDTHNNHGVMINDDDQSRNYRSSHFEMQELPQEVARRIETMSPGDVSDAFVLINNKNQEVAAIVKLTNRIDGHRATLTDDYNMLKELYENHKKEEILREWLENKIKDTYVRIEDGWNNCEFRYNGWVKDAK